MSLIKSILKTATIRQSSMTLTTTVINGALGVIFFILLARLLGPSSFAFVAIAISVITITADLADLGANNSIVRFVPEYLRRDKEKAYRFLKFGLELKVMVWVVVVLTSSLLLPFVSNNLLKQPELLPYLYISLLGAGGVMLFSYAASCFQALERFTSWGVLFVSTNLLRLLIVGLIALLGVLNAENSLIVYSAIPILGFLGALCFLPTKEFLSVREGFKVAKEFFSYSKWVFVISGCFVVMSRLDIFLTARFSSIEQTGIYGAANQLALVMPQLISALGVVTAPKFASFGETRVMMTYFKKLQCLVLGLGVLVLLLLPLGAFLIPLILGNIYQTAFPIFAILVVASVVALISVPMQDCIRYFHRRPDYLAVVFITQLVFLFFLASFLGNQYQSIGVVLGVLGASLVNFMLTLIVFLMLTQRKVE